MSQRTLWALVAVALLPLLGAMVMYFGGIGIPEARNNKGTLVVSRPSLDQWPLYDAQGRPWENPARWQILHVSASCARDCRRWNRQLPQLDQALGRDSPRVVLQQIQLGRSATASAALVFRSSLESPPKPGIWVADPLGNLVLYYSFDQPPKALLEDLEHLLKVSKVG